ncbi:MAG: threonine synthase [Candidatus Margulisbacteria bacterium GWF2_35_9]|nr:MAG: threonine synthase [Candidatus Margulisbacteria bacterium GWF2_35_9]
MMWNGLIDKYRKYMPVSDETNIITLMEGNTPLIPAVYIPQLIGKKVNVFFKYEGLNPTGSFKDRGMTMAITKAVEKGKKAVICASTGNTSASASAYAARAGIRSVVIIPEGKIALGKLAQAMMHGALVIEIEGNFDVALNIVREISATHPIELVNSINPYRIEGQKSAAFEIVDALGRAPDYHSLPVGNAGNITAYWKGYTEYKTAGVTNTLPKMIGFQSEGACPIVLGRVVDHPETIATAIRIGNPASWDKAVEARDESGGLIDSVTDEEILSAFKVLAYKEGVFCEPASAASVAGILKKKAIFKDGDTIVCTLTGHGLKDPDNAMKMADRPVKSKNSAQDIIRLIGL